MGNGAKAQQKRERTKNGAKDGKAKSQLKTNEAARSYQCEYCKHTFLVTANEKIFRLHATKHTNISISRCFPHLKDEPAPAPITLPVRPKEEPQRKEELVEAATPVSAAAPAAADAAEELGAELAEGSAAPEQTKEATHGVTDEDAKASRDDETREGDGVESDGDAQVKLANSEAKPDAEEEKSTEV